MYEEFGKIQLHANFDCNNREATFFSSHINIPLLPDGLRIMADQGFKYAKPLLITPNKNVRLPENLRKYVNTCKFVQRK